MRYLMVDHVTDLLPDRSLVAFKNVTMESDAMEHHFPYVPIYPGALTLESMAQAAGYLVMRSANLLGRPPTIALLTSVERARFQRPARPGDQIRLEVELDPSSEPLVTARAVALVAGDTIARARLGLVASPVPDRLRPQVVPVLQRMFEQIERRDGWDVGSFRA